MTDVNVLAISLEEFTDAGEVLFRAENVYHLDKLGPGEPLIIWLTVEGTIPGWGVSCVDTAGNKKVYSINLSQVKKLVQHQNRISAICNSTLLLLH